MSEHEHKWQTIIHVDACHFFRWGYECKCGATRQIEHERPLASGDWLDYGDFPDPENCERCRELQDGAPLADPVDEIVET